MPLNIPQEYLPRYSCPWCNAPLVYADTQHATNETPVSCPNCAHQWIVTAKTEQPDPSSGKSQPIHFELRDVTHG